MNPRFWNEAEVTAAVGLPAVIESLGRVLAHEYAGTAWNIDKTMASWPTGEGGRASAHALGAVDLDDSLTIFKTWVNTPAGARALLSIFSSADGTLHGIAEAGTAGALRTAAISGLATRLLADPDADELAVLGAGRQALRQVAAVAAVRPLRRVRVWSRTADSAVTLADRVRTELGLDAITLPTVEETTRDAPVVTLVTRAAQPFLTRDHLAAGAHLNAVGAILPANAEFDPALLDSAALIVVDSEANARRGSRELRESLGDTPDADWSRVRVLADVVAGKVTRPPSPGLTVFKAMGMGLSDLAVARLLIGGSQ